jgi:hypothetical protein
MVSLLFKGHPNTARCFETPRGLALSDEGCRQKNAGCAIATT